MPPEASPSNPSPPISPVAESLNDDLSDRLNDLTTGVTQSPLTEENPSTENSPTETPSTENSPTETPSTENSSTETSPTENPNQQVRMRAEKGKIWIVLPPELKKEASTVSYAWSEILQQIQQRLSGDARTWKADTPVRIMAGDRLLDSTQVKELVEILQLFNLRLKRLYTSRRQTAVATATSGFSVEQHSPQQLLKSKTDSNGQTIADPIYIQMTLRSGAEIRHDGSVIVMGDMNPGSSVVAEGDILVWGKLRGLVHAGSAGNAGAIVMATQMQPSQIRIADFVARGPSTVPNQFFPEVAYVTPQGKISIAAAQDFTRP